VPDKLILVTRKDLSPAQQAVQSAHALRQWVEEHPDADARWFRESNYLALLSVQDEPRLRRLWEMAEDSGVKASGFLEPDLGGALTAVALEPGPGSRRLTRSLPLALQTPFTPCGTHPESGCGCRS
jgi:peptidyl-tRNA hydrolase